MCAEGHGSAPHPGGGASLPLYIVSPLRTADPHATTARPPSILWLVGRRRAAIELRLAPLEKGAGSL